MFVERGNPFKGILIIGGGGFGYGSKLLKRGNEKASKFRFLFCCIFAGVVPLVGCLCEIVSTNFNVKETNRALPDEAIP